MGQVLFSGRPILGGLSNEQELARACPKKFRDNNPWSDYAMQLFSKGGNISNWKWKSDDKAERNIQKNCFECLRKTPSVWGHDKESIAGWMLSEMLVEVPVYVPGKKS